MKRFYLISILLLSVYKICGQTACCSNGVCQPGEKYPTCPDCPCYNNLDSTGTAKQFFNKTGIATIGKTSAEANGMCYSYTASQLPGTFCFTYTEPAGAIGLEIHVTPTGCTAGTFQTQSQVVSTSSGGCSGTGANQSSNGFSVGNWRTFDDSCNLLTNNVSVGCNRVPGKTYVVCVDVSAPGVCTGVEICPILTCYNGICTVPPKCIITAETATTITCKGKSNGTAIATICDTASGYSYLWDDPAAQTTSTAVGLKGGIYHVKIISPFGCDSTFTAIVPDSTCIFPIQIPNVITPNGDKDNQYFYIKNLEDYPNSRLEIFDRWGLKLYENSNYPNDWDGLNYKNQMPVSDGVYYYILYLSDTEKTTYKGFIQVIRG